MQAPSASSLFNGLALVCFSLLGALLLRVATRQELLAPITGTLLGLAYTLFLVIAPAIGARWKSLSRYGAWLQYCGMCLSALIVLETFHSGIGMTAAMAAAAALVSGVISIAVAGAMNRGGLANFAALASLVAVAGIGLAPAQMVLRAAAVLLLALAGLAAGHWRRWAAVRTTTLATVGSILGVGVLTTAHRVSFPQDVAASLLVALVLFWLLVAANHALLLHKMRGGEAAGLPAATLWAGGMALYHSPDWSGAAGATATAALWAACLFAAARARKPAAGHNGLAAAAAIATLLFVPRLDSSGIGVAVAAACAFCAWVWTGGVLFRVCALFLAAAATLVALVGGPLITADIEGAGPALVAGIVLTLLLLLFWRLEERYQHDGAPRTSWWSGVILLLCASTSTFGALRAVALTAGIRGGWLRMTESLIIVGLAVSAMLYGGRTSRREIFGLGLAGVGLLLAKVVFRDIFVLSPGQLLLDVVGLGCACLVASRTFRARESQDGETAAAPRHEDP